MSQVDSEGGLQRRHTVVDTRPATHTARTAPAPKDYPLYDPMFEHDACGTGFVANVSGKRERRIVAQALEALVNLAHRGAMDAASESSDGVGVLTQIPHRLLGRWLAERRLPEVAEGTLIVGCPWKP